MWKYTIAILTLTASGYAAAPTVTPKDTGEMSMPMMQPMQGPSSMMMIPPSSRALDFQQAFELLRKEKTTTKVYFQLIDGSAINNIIDMTLMNNSTLILFRCNSTQGIRFQVVKVEDILGLNY